MLDPNLCSQVDGGGPQHFNPDWKSRFHPGEWGKKNLPRQPQPVIKPNGNEALWGYNGNS